MVKYLVETTANLEATSNEGYTPLHVASDRNRFEVVNFLVEAGADIDAMSSVGKTPLSAAFLWTLLKVRKCLKEAIYLSIGLRLLIV